MARGVFSMLRKGGRRRGIGAFMAQSLHPGARSLGRWFFMESASLQIKPGLAPRLGRSFTGLGWRQLYAGAPGHGKADGDGLLGRAGAVFSLANMVNFLAHEFTGLGGG